MRISNITCTAGHKLGALMKVSNKRNVMGKPQVHSVIDYASLCYIFYTKGYVQAGKTYAPMNCLASTGERKNMK